MGCAVLPHLRPLVEIIENGLKDEQQKVRTITALAIAALAEAATPYGIESFDSVLVPLWTGIWNHQGKVREGRGWGKGGREGGGNGGRERGGIERGGEGRW